jgi:homopolymeric O-antigen transport system permease protein
MIADAARGNAVTIRIQPPQRTWHVDVHELWDYRELLFFLVWRDVKVRYKQTALGAAWAVIQPLATMAVFSIFFGRLAGMPSDGLPYPLFSLAGLVPWTYFSTAMSNGSASVVSSQQLVSKVYFPRLLIPIAAVLTPLVDLAVALVILAAMLVAYGVPVAPAMAALPLFVLLAIASALAASLWLSALHVRYRDVRYLVPFLIQFWLFVTPIAYPSALVPDRWRLVYGLNPMVGVVDGFRWALAGGPWPGIMLVPSAAGIVIAVAAGVVYFRRLEHTFADVI